MSTLQCFLLFRQEYTDRPDCFWTENQVRFQQKGRQRKSFQRRKCMNELDRKDTNTMTKTVRADQVGSLLRPPELLQARTQHQQGRITLEQLRHAEDRAIL